VSRDALALERCVPCEGGLEHLLSRDDLGELLAAVSPRWRVENEGKTLERDIAFKTFRRAMDFLNRLADVAEVEGHHPDFCLHGWRHVCLSLTTHAVGGLTRNDLILAAKIDALLSA
jgi:4a-hydroxytetrahydrobiopterin dehydratase